MKVKNRSHQIILLSGLFTFVIAGYILSRSVEFRYYADLSIRSALTFNLKKTLTKHGVDMLLDRLVIKPDHAYTYLCYPNLPHENWIITGENVSLMIDGQTANLDSYEWIYDSTVEEGSKGGEPGWMPPYEESRCVKFGFPISDARPAFILLTIPALEDAMTKTVPKERVLAAYPRLLAQGIDMEWRINENGEYAVYKHLPAGMTQEEAYRRFRDALGYIRPGPWKFRIILFH